MSKFLSWGALRDLATGTLLVFPEQWDIYPHCIVPAGTLAIVSDNCLSTEFPTIDLLPGDPLVAKALVEWNGCISFAPMNDGYTWTDESPWRSMFKASLETRHFSFEAYSTTKSGAKAAMREGLIAHARQRVLMPGQLIRDMWQDVEIHQIEMGCCYRDRHKITNL